MNRSVSERHDLERRGATAGAPLQDTPPVRLIARHVSQLLLTRSDRWTPLIPPERLAKLVVETVLSASIAHLPYRQTAGEPVWVGLEAAAESARPVSVLAVARSLNLPYGTIARRADEMVVAGLLLKERRGVRVTPDFLADPRLGEIADANKADLELTLSMLAAAGHLPASSLLASGFAHLPAGVVERLLLAFSLRVLESIIELYGDVINGLLSAIIIAGNVRHLLQDPTISQRFAGEDAPPPDELRRPIPVRELARQTQLPFETTRRRVSDLRAQGYVELSDAGVIVPARVLMGPAHLADNRRIMQHFEQLLKTLASLAAAPC